MLDQLGRHGGFDLTVKTVGDLAVDLHHTVEDTGIALGAAFAEALGDKAGVRRFASVRVPLDEALADVVVDLSGRPYLVYEVALPEHPVIYGQPPFDAQLTEEFFRAFVTSRRHHAARDPGAGPQHPPHRRGDLQGRGPGACATPCGSRAAASPPPRACSDGRGRTVHRRARLRDRQPALGARRRSQHLGADARLSADPDEVAAAAGVVLPGVGAFGRCMEALRRSGLDRVAVDGGRVGRAPSSASASACSCSTRRRRSRPGERGLGVLPGVVRLLPEGVKRPQMQWNRLDVAAEPPAVRGPARQAVDVLRALLRARRPGQRHRHLRLRRRGRRPPSARANVWATQFHPEKSGSQRPAAPGQLRRGLCCRARHPPGGRPRRVPGGPGRLSGHRLRGLPGHRPARRALRAPLPGRLRPGDRLRRRPAGQARRFADAGAAWVHVVDLDAARSGEPRNRPVVAAMAAACRRRRRRAVRRRRALGGGGRGAVRRRRRAGRGRHRRPGAAGTGRRVGRSARRAPGRRVAVGLDVRGREVAVRGWERGSGLDVAEALAALRASRRGRLRRDPDRGGRHAGGPRPGPLPFAARPHRHAGGGVGRRGLPRPHRGAAGPRGGVGGAWPG